MKTLIVEDDEKIASFVVKGLRQEGISCDQVGDGVEALLQAGDHRYDAMIVDLMLPGLDGLSLIRRLRSGKVDTPVLILSAKSSVSDRVAGLQAGADDYLIKPFAFSELLARLQALVRRANAAPAAASCYVVGELRIDLLTRKVKRGDESLEIQPLEYSLLVYLARNAGRVVSKTMIMEHVWEYNFDPGTNVVEACVCRLRDKVDRPFETPLIHTVRGFGYVLEER
jgi:DNA-binding response OmpR family regulator